ncbi:MAG: thioredoxin family protein [Flavobacteriales bacterium]
MTEYSKTIDGLTIANEMTFQAYVEAIELLFAQGKATGNHQGEDYLEYTKMNLQRMHRWAKTYTPSNALVELMGEISMTQHWYVITEGWCGDSAQNLVALERIAELSPNVTTHYLFRDENPQWIERFHTNDAHSIPKLIIVNDQREVIHVWGPRPAAASVVIEGWKNQGLPLNDWKPLLHKWYADNKQVALEADFITVIQNQVSLHATR